jgi:phosphate starvation-inducible PhoH-like protein
LNSCAVILDEAQNTTASQMLMFLTRLGHHSKMIVTGDDSQIDLEGHLRSGLIDAVERLRGVRGIGIVRLHKVDIVRHKLVQTIVHAYADGRASHDYRAEGGGAGGDPQLLPDLADG